MPYRFLVAGCLAASLLVCTAAHAQVAGAEPPLTRSEPPIGEGPPAEVTEHDGLQEDDPPTSSTAPEWRVELDAPGAGFGYFFGPDVFSAQLTASGSSGLRLVHESGHGAMVRAHFVYAVGWFGGEGVGSVHFLYSYEHRLEGDLRKGVAIGLFAGGALGRTQTSGCCSNDSVISGGPVGGASVTFRAYGFTAGFDVDLGLYVSPRPDDRPLVELAASVQYRMAVGFY